METSKLKKFAQFARRSLIEQVSAKLKLVLAEGSPARRESPKVVKKLEEKIKVSSKKQVIEKAAYLWFNRLCALRYMDVNHYTRIGVVSPTDGQFQPEILAEAKMGHVDEEMVPEKIRQHIFALLGGTAPSYDPQAEAYRLLVVATCNYYNRAMPYLFERIADYTELLMPDDLLSGNSVMAYILEAMTPVACQDVEIIGWLYQFYISEKKGEVFDGLKKKKKITSENIPAATQLFTPHWIVRYLVENSLGRLWMLNRPKSKLIEKMDYYIPTEYPKNTEEEGKKSGSSIVEKDFLHFSSPEEIKVCDPACGSGHMLVYAFDLLYVIYEEEGYDPCEIPEKILTHNLYGIEIDERAGELAAFALTMKARAKHRRFFGKQVVPNICVLEKVNLTTEYMENPEWKKLIDELCKSGFNCKDLIHDLCLFPEADNFGSLLRPCLQAERIHEAIELLEDYNQSIKAPSFGQSAMISKCRIALKQADYLSTKYHVVIANPPYMGGKGMNARLKVFLQNNYTDVKSDLFSAFIIRNTELALPGGQLGYMSPFVWMFISSYEKLRSFLINQKTITSLVQLEYSGFEGATVPICTFTVENAHYPNFKGGYVRLSNFRGAENQGPKTLEAIKNPDCDWFYRASSADFKKIPGSPIAYWVSKALTESFSNTDKTVGSFVQSEGKNVTTDNARFTRCWWEVQFMDVGGVSKRWFPFATGGSYRKWYGNHIDVVDWSDEALNHYKKAPAGRLIRKEFWYLQGITWSKITSNKASFRLLLKDQTYQEVAILLQPQSEKNIHHLLGLLNSKISEILLKAIAPTLNYQLDDVCRIPWHSLTSDVADSIVLLMKRSITDWDSYEISWDFNSHPLLHPDCRQSTLKDIYAKLRAHWRKMTMEMKRLEEENNRIFIEAYGLQDELTPDIPINEITLTCNPYYRYGCDKGEEELEALLLADTMKELISYAVGCMFGRYSLEKPGLILANQREDIFDFRSKILNLKDEPDLDDQSKIKDLQSKTSFMPDINNVIPILDGDWFPDDISERFHKFLRVTFGDEHFEENLKFIEKALGKNIRKYFMKDFYNEHVKRYKKRPIYWLFSSPKGSFNALIYMHRYRPDTVSVVLNDYLREFCIKLSSSVDHLKGIEARTDASQAEKTKALKEIEKLNKMIKELEDYEREVLYPLATAQVKIDLDDGVKVNYGKFGSALKKIPGLDAKED